jgi:PAS domain-containing protein
MASLVDQIESATPLQALLDERVLNLPDRLLDLLPVGVYVCDQAGLIVRYNRAAADYGGAPRKLATQRFATVAPIGFTAWTGAMCPMRNVQWPT